MLKVLLIVSSFAFSMASIASTVTKASDEFKEDKSLLYSNISKVIINDIFGDVSIFTRTDDLKEVAINGKSMFCNQSFFESRLYKEDMLITQNQGVLNISNPVINNNGIKISKFLCCSEICHNYECRDELIVLIPKQCHLNILRSSYTTYIDKLNTFLNAHMSGDGSRLEIKHLKQGGSILLSGNTVCKIDKVSGNLFQSQLFSGNFLSLKKINVRQAEFSINKPPIYDGGKVDIAKGKINTLNVSMCNFPSESQISSMKKERQNYSPIKEPENSLPEFIFKGKSKSANLICFGQGKIHVHEVTDKWKINPMIGAKISIDKIKVED